MPGSFVSGKCLDQMKLRLSRMTRRRTPIMLTALAAVMVSPYRWAFAPSKAHPRLRSLARGLCSRDRAGPAERPASPEQADPESAIQVNLSNETVRLPLYPGTAIGKTVWYVLLDASDAGLLNRVLWKDRMGERPMPEPRRSLFRLQGFRSIVAN